MRRLRVVETLPNGKQVEYPADRINTVSAKEGAKYTLVDIDTPRCGLAVRRKGQVLELVVDC